MPRYYRDPRNIVTHGTAAGHANYGDTSHLSQQEQQRSRRNSRPRAYGGYGSNFAGNQDEDINLQMARLMMAQSEDPSERGQLGRIIAAQDPELREKAQEASLYQWKKLVDRGMDADDPMSSSEWDSARKDWEMNQMASILPMPRPLMKRKTERKDPDVQIANSQRSVESYHDLPEGSLAGMVSIDKQTGEVDSASVDRAHDRAAKMKRPMLNRDQRSMYKDAIKASQDRLKAMQEDPVMFNQNKKNLTPMVRPNPDSRWTDPDDVLKYDLAKESYDKEMARLHRLQKAMLGGIDDDPDETPNPDETGDPGVAPPPTVYTQTQPFSMKGMSPDEMLNEMGAWMAQVDESGIPQWFIDPETNKAELYRPSK